MNLFDYLGNWLWLLTVLGIFGTAVFVIPLHTTREEKAQNAQAQQDAQDTALARSLQLRSRDDLRLLLRDDAGGQQAAGQADGGHGERRPAQTRGGPE